MELWVEKIPEDEDSDRSQKDREVPEDQAEGDGVKKESCGKRPTGNAGVGGDGQDK